jgi:hypothetical protein
LHIEADAEEENEFLLYFPANKKGVALARDDPKRKQSSATSEEPRKRDQKALDKKHGRQDNLKKAPNVKKRLFNALTEEANSFIEEVKEGKEEKEDENDDVDDEGFNTRRYSSDDDIFGGLGKAELKEEKRYTEVD